MIIKINAINEEKKKFSKGQHILNLSEHLGKEDFMISIDLPGCCKLDFKFCAVSNKEKDEHTHNNNNLPIVRLESGI